jgi:gliding motility-associated-like protein
VWTVPAGATITSDTTGGGTTSITVDFGTVSTGSITVTPVNACGNGTMLSQTLTFNDVPAGGAITVPDPVCEGTTHTATLTGVTGNPDSYKWFLPTGATGTSVTDEIDITFAQSGSEIKVVPVNGCGEGDTVRVSTAVNLDAAAAGPITGTQSICDNQAGEVYEIDPVDNATSYTWVLTAGTGETVAATTDNSTTNSLTVDFGDADFYILTVTPKGLCKDGAPESITITNAGIVVPTVTLEQLPNPVCEDSEVKVVAKYTGGGLTPTFVWTGTGNPNAKGDTLTIISPVNNASIEVEMTSSLACASPLSVSSTTLTLDVEPVPSAAVINEADMTICLRDTVLTTQSITVGTGTWSKFTGDAGTLIQTGNDVAVSNLSAGTTTRLIWTVNTGTACANTADTLSITVLPAVTIPDAGADQTICETTTTLTLTGNTPSNPSVETGTWTAVGPATITIAGTTSSMVVGDNKFVYMIDNGQCAMTDTVTITVDAEPIQPTVANASITTCANSVQMEVSAVSPSTAVGVWSGFTSPQNMVPVDEPDAFLNGLTSGSTATLTWSVTNGACTTPKTVTVTVNKLADLSANDILIGSESLKGKTKEICLSASTVTLRALPFDAATETGNWVLLSGSNTDFDPLGSNPQTITLNSVGQTRIGYEIGKQTGGCPVDRVEFTLDVQNVVLSAGVLTASNTCEGTQLATPFTVTPTGAGSTPTYKWYLNNVLQSASGSSYTPASSTAVGTHTVKVEVTSSELCASPAMDEATTTFTVHANPVVSIVGSGIYCPGGLTTDLVASPGGLSSYVWTKGTSTTPVGNAPILTIGSPGIYHVTATDANGCIGKDQKEGKEAVISATIETNIGTTQCLGETIVLSTSEQLADHYSWSRNGVVVGSGPEYAATKSGVYKVTLTYGTIPGSSCEASDQEVLIFVDQPAPVIAQSDTVVCETSPYQLVASDLNGLPGTYTWYKTGIVNPIGSGTSFTVTETGNYYVELDNNYCENQSSSVYVEVDRVPRVRIEPKVQYILEGTSAVLSAANSTGGHYYAWTSSVGTVIDSPSDPTILVHPDSSHTKYYVTVQSLNKVCEAIDSADVYVELAVRPWNSFSPNGDGVYDSWIIESMDTYPNAVVEVYNRWGNLVWQSKGYTKPWQGENFRNGLPLPVATYYYIIYPNGGSVKKPLTGHVTIVR